MGVGVLVLATPMTAIFVNIMTNQREQMLMFTDKRIILVNQLLAGMKALKTYAWEAAQEARVRNRISSEPYFFSTPLYANLQLGSAAVSKESSCCVQSLANFLVARVVCESRKLPKCVPAAADSHMRQPLAHAKRVEQ